MKFSLAILVYLLFGLLLTWGIIELVHGRPALLITGVVIYAALLTWFGCLPPKSHPH